VAGRGNGSTLEELARSAPPDATSLVPPFVCACVEYIENEGMSAEGLYRVPGNRAHVDQLMESFKEGRFTAPKTIPLLASVFGHAWVPNSLIPSGIISQAPADFGWEV